MFRVAVGGVAIGHHDRLEIGHHSVAGGRFAADIGDSAGDQNRVEPPRAQDVWQFGGAGQKGRIPVFQDLGVLGLDVAGRPYRVPQCAFRHAFDTFSGFFRQRHGMHI